MNKDEMKNKYTAFISEISEVLGLGKPVDIIKLCATTDLFFQPLEKRITELEQEVLEVRQHLDLTEREWGKDLDKQIHFKTLCTKLEKENAELKRDKEDLIFIRNQNAKCMCEDKERFTKAKELLKQWLQTSNASSCDNINIVTDTEQFLSEVEK